MHVEKKGERERGKEEGGGREGGREGEHDSLNFEAKDKRGGDKVLQLTHS